MDDDATLAQRVIEAADGSDRFVVAIAGPPGAGKSTLAEQLGRDIDRLCGEPCAAVVAMDGFHYDNAVLDARGQRSRKGASFTFDVGGYRSTLQRLRSREDGIAVPVFDRTLELSRAGAHVIEASHRIILAEGNYLLLDEAPWTTLAEYFDLTIAIEVDEAVLKERLVARWLTYGFDRPAAEARVRLNDLVNAHHVQAHSRPAGLTVKQKT